MSINSKSSQIIEFAVNGLIAFLLVLIFASSALAQEKPSITIDDVLERGDSFVDQVDWLNDETLVIRVRSRKDGITVHSAISKSENGPTVDSLLSEKESLYSTSHGHLSPAGEFLLSRNDGKWRIKTVETNVDEGLLLPDLPPGIPKAYGWEQISWSENGQLISISEVYDGRQKGFETSEVREISGTKIKETASISRQGYIRATRIITAMSNTAELIQTRVFPGCYSGGQSFSPNNDLVVTLICFEAENPHTKIIRIDHSTGDYKEIFRVDAILQQSLPKLSPNGSLIAFPIEVTNSGWAAFLEMAIIDARTGELKQRLRPNAETGITIGRNYYWSHDGSEIYVGVRASGLDEIWALSLEGDHRRLAGGERQRYGMKLAPSGKKLSYLTLDGYGYRDVRVFDVVSQEEVVYHVIDDPRKSFDLGSWRTIEWKSERGVRPKGWLITPPRFDPAYKYPLYVDVHGNGTGSDLYLWAPITVSVSRGPLEWHALAAMGYVIFVPDYASTGNYGPEPIQRRKKENLDAAIFDAKDVTAGVKHVVSLGFIDEDRIAVLGHSLGGPRVFKILTDEPGLFAAAILNESVGLDRRSMFEVVSSGVRAGSDSNRIMRTWLGPDIGDDPEPYKRNDVLDAVKIMTPTLFLRGGNKGAASLSMYASHETAFTLIRQAGTPTRYFTFLDEGHTYSTPEAAKVAFDLVTQWIAEHMPPD